jgi:hypothetical protein
MERKYSSVDKLFNPDQLEALTRNKMLQWSDETIIKCLKMRFSLGNSYSLDLITHFSELRCSELMSNLMHVKDLTKI